MKEKINVRKIFLIVFFIVLFIIISKLAKAPDDEVTLQEKLKKLNNNYQYSYEIKIGDVTYNFSGKVMDDKEAGTRKVNNKSIKYYKDESFAYEVRNRELYPIYDLYENIDDKLLNVDYLKSLISNLKFSQKGNSYTFKVDNKKITITTDKDNVKMIEITVGNDYYKLTYRNINEVTSVNY